jgi:hypothetical protein
MSITGFKVTKLLLDTNNRMIRVGIGKNEGRWFARVDLWKVGFRLTK